MLAAWSYGLGKSVAFTSDAGQRWGGNWVSWAGYQQFWSQCIRWVMRLRSTDRFRLTPSFSGGEGLVRLDAFTPDGRFVTDLEFEATVVSPDFESETITVRQTTPGGYTGSFRPSKKGTYTISLTYEKDGVKRNLVTGLSVPYSAEYRRLETNHELLHKIADAGGGHYYADPVAADLFTRDFPKTRDIQDVWEALLLVALCLFFMDVFVRRVVIDVRKTAKTAWERTRALVTMKPLEPAPTDARLATLLQRKAQLREEATSRYSGQVRSAERRAGDVDAATPERETDVAAGASDVLGDFASGGTSRAEEARPTASTRSGADDDRQTGQAKTRKGESKKDDEPSSSGYTARLLQAKKRALKDEQDSEQGD